MPRPSHSPEHPRASSEDGFILIELIIAAFLLALISTSVYFGIGAASRGSGNDRNRSIAVNLAQQDQDRMKAMKATDVAGYSNSSPTTLAGVQYTVASRGVWISDSSGTITCTSGSATANYIKTTSTVTWTNMGALKPVVLSSIIAPSTGATTSSQGVLAIQLQDQGANAVSGIPVTLGSPANMSDTTDSQGCVVFTGVAAGSYTASWSSSGYVDTSGATSVQKTVNVVAGATTTNTFNFAAAGSIAVTFNTKVGAAAQQAAQANVLTVSHPNLPAPGTLEWDPTGGLQTTINATNLFPFTSAYGVYAGDCTSNDPTTYTSNYYTSNPGAVTVAPGNSYAVNVRVPAINLAITRSGSAYTTAHVVVKTTDSGCTGTYTQSGGLTSSGGVAVLPNPGFPFGHYSACADDGTRKVTNASVNNTTAAGTAAIPLAIPTSGFSNLGVCS
jgi:Tfp pilus assembly protein PilV